MKKQIQIEDRMFGQSAEFENIRRNAKIIAAADVTVLIQGESGSGKELMAEFLHASSRRHDNEMVTINCAALPENLAESELFGHRKGSFTDASSDQPGRIQQADKGTLFLDEIGELPLAVQGKLLRFLENGECQRIGDNKPHKVDVRIIAATNRDLQQEVKAGRFREDLYYRLNVVPLQVPALRERSSDITFLINQFSALFARKHCLDAPRYNMKALEACQRYNWPGNIRELKNFCERMVILMSGQTIGESNLPAEIYQQQQAASFSLPDSGIVLEKLEAELIHQAMDKSRGNQSKAARLLGLTRSALLYRMKKYALKL